MNILYLSWTENSASDMIETLQQLGHNVCAQLHELSFYFSDALIPSLQQVFASQSFDCIFTFNFIPPVSNVAEAIQIPYLCWVYDCPHVTLYSNSLRNRCNYIFLFDRKMQQDALLHGALHAYHLPLAINADRLASHLSLSGSRDTFFPTTYRHEISFVGSLYEKTTFEHLKNVPPHMKGYLDGIIAAQKQVWGAGCDLGSTFTRPRKRNLSSTSLYPLCWGIYHSQRCVYRRYPEAGYLGRADLSAQRHHQCRSGSTVLGFRYIVMPQGRAHGNCILHSRNAGYLSYHQDQSQYYSPVDHVRYSASRHRYSRLWRLSVKQLSAGAL